MATSTKGLASAWAKYRRGREHAVAFRNAIVAFLHAHPQPTFAIEFEDTTEEGVDRVCWLVVEHGYPEPPDELALLLGDAIHGYRCALDHLAWQLVAAAGTSLTEHEEKGVQFPVYKTETDFDKKASRTRMPGVAPAALAVIKKAQGYPLSSPPPSVHTLQKLSNDDKHRTIHLVAAAMWKAKGGLPVHGMPAGWVLASSHDPGLAPRDSHRWHEARVRHSITDGHAQRIADACGLSRGRPRGDSSPRRHRRRSQGAFG